MNFIELIIPFVHVDSAIRLYSNKEKVSFSHVLIDNKTIFYAIKAINIIPNQCCIVGLSGRFGDWDKAPSCFKNDCGKVPHTFFGVTPSKPVPSSKPKTIFNLSKLDMFLMGSVIKYKNYVDNNGQKFVMMLTDGVFVNNFKHESVIYRSDTMSLEQLDNTYKSKNGLPIVDLHSVSSTELIDFF